ncbi:hypothetical protein GA0061101_1682 [Rhizobium lusitanum]|uniref:Uncharacterized protein n=1 Tax=Rhizobium lusitanum TaxID=293958 RepID=A0A1C3XMM1_9HYPH|nr:hypothetical protein GA0061101_1682 [Rhizobium lusitanum]
MAVWPGFDRMTKARRVAMFTLSCLGILLAGLLGFHLAGVLAMILFAPLGAIAGLILGSVTLRGFLELISELLKTAFL